VVEWYGEIDFQTNSEAMRESMRGAPIHQCVPMIELPTGHDDTTMKITSVDQFATVFKRPLNKRQFVYSD
jgi:hypothetical protein